MKAHTVAFFVLLSCLIAHPSQATEDAPALPLEESEVVNCESQTEPKADESETFPITFNLFQPWVCACDPSSPDGGASDCAPGCQVTDVPSTEWCQEQPVPPGCGVCQC